MARRTTWRIPIRLKVKLIAEGRMSAGMVTNLSEYGMLINTDNTDFNRDSDIGITIPVEDGVLHVLGKPVRLAKINGGCDVGIELLNPPQNYLDFVENLLYVL